MALIDVRNLGVRYRTRRGPAYALDEVSLSVEPGQVVCVVGESGCGKTTMALALMGLLPETAAVSGEIILGGRDLRLLNPSEWRRVRGKEIAMIFQGAMNAWNPVYPIGDQIVETILAHEPDIGLHHARERVAELYIAVGLSPDRRDEFPHQYSGGMKQRAVIAMALACNPNLVVADEPTTALDVIVQDRILRELRRIQRERRLSMLYITHDMAVVAELADLVAVMYAGRVVEMGPVQAIFTRPTHPYTAALLAASPSLQGPKRALKGLAGAPPSLIELPGGCRFGSRCAHATEQCTNNAPLFTMQRDELAAACWHPLPSPVSGTPIEDHTEAVIRRRSDNDGRDPIVRVKSAKKLFPISRGIFKRAARTVHAVDDVSFDIAPGEAFGLVGESGSGKTTLGRILVRLSEPTTGRVDVRLNGTATPIAETERHTFRRGVQMIFQDPYESLNPRMTIGDIVSEPLDVLQLDTREARAERVMSMLERVGLAPAATFVYRYPHELSGGQRQRVAIARAMVVRPKFVVADEPTSMLDVSVRVGIIDLLLDLKHDFGLGYLYITHDLAVARYICDRIAVMYQGRIVELGETDDVLQRPLHPYTRALIAAVPVPNPAYRRPLASICEYSSTTMDAGPHCRFLERCPVATARCHAEHHPPLAPITPGHLVACYEATERQ